MKKSKAYITNIQWIFVFTIFGFSSGCSSACNDQNPGSHVNRSSHKQHPVSMAFDQEIDLLVRQHGVEEGQPIGSGAYEDIRSGGKPALETLISHVDDSRVTWWNKTVGELSIELVCDYADPFGSTYYKGRIGLDGEMYYSTEYLRDHLMSGEATPERLRSWWREVNHRSLANIRLEAIEWHIDRETRIGFKDKSIERDILGLLFEMRDMLTEEDRSGKKVGRQGLLRP